MDTIKVKDINWGDRARKDYGDITALAQSIKEKGIIHPIVIDEANTLIAGGRRLTAIISLGWDETPVTRRGELSELQLRELELEENLMRKDLTWQENAGLIAEIHRLKKINNPDWTQQKTASTIEKTKAFVSQNLQLAEGLEKYPDLKDIKDVASARTQLRRRIEQEQRAIVAKTTPSYDFIYNDNALSILPKIKDETIDLVLLDPPYGVNIHEKEGRGTERTGSWTWETQSYNDSPEHAIEILDGILKEVQRILKPGAHCFIFFALSMDLDLDGIIRKTIGKYLGFQKLPLFWVKNTHSNKDPYKRFGITYEGIYFAWKGAEPRDLLQASHAILSYPVDAREKAHPSEKPMELYRRLIGISTQQNEVVLDPTMGSGASIAAALSLGRKAVGIEIDETWFNVAKEKVMNQMKGGSGEEGR